MSFYHEGGEYSNTTMGGSLFEAAAKALEFFCAPHWNGPRPARNTLLRNLTGASRLLLTAAFQTPVHIAPRSAFG